MNWIDRYQNKIERGAGSSWSLLTSMNQLKKGLNEMKVNIGPKQVTLENVQDQKLSPEFLQLVEKFESGLNMTVDCILQSGQVLVEMVRLRPDAKEIMIKRNPWMRPAMLEALESIGLGRKDPHVLLLGSVSIQNKLAELSIDDQKQVFSKGIDVVIKMPENENQKPVVETKPVMSMTYAQITQTVEDGKLRSVREQIEFIRRKQEAKAKRGGLPYEMDGENLVILCRCVLTPPEVKRMLAEWKQATKAKG